MKNSSDYRLHRRDDKSSLYRKSPGLWRSEELNRWICTDPELMRAILNHENFAVHDYRVDGFVERFSINLDLLQKINPYLPLAREGDEHKNIRKRFIREIAQNMAEALKQFDHQLKIEVEKVRGVSGEFEFVEQLVKPALDEAMRSLAGIPVLKGFDYWSMAQMFDETISVTKRVAVNKILANLMAGLPDYMDEDEKLFRTAMLALGSNSLLGSLLESFVSVLLRGENQLFCDLDWGEELPATGVPIIEKQVVADTHLGEHFFARGERIRLYLESAGYQDTDHPAYSLLYFAPSRHLCPGMSVSLEAWKLFAGYMAKLAGRYSIVSIAYRDNDCVFNYPESIVLRLYD